MRLPAERAMVLYDFDVEASTAGCLDLSGEPLREPFLIDTIAKRLRDRPRPFALAGDWHEVCRVLAGQPSLPVHGMIFHTGRCGSTLLANALSALGHTMVLKEASFFSALAAEALAAPAGHPAVAERIRALRRTCLPPTTPEQTRQVWKFASWNVLAEPVWSAAFPDTPSAFLWRPALEVLESEVASPPMWANGKGNAGFEMFAEGRELIERAGITELTKPQKVSLAAWLTVARKGVELAAAGALVLPFSAIRDDLAGVLRAVCARFGIAVSDAEVQSATGVRRFYSKDPNGTRAFSGTDSHQRPASLAPKVAARVRELAAGLENELTEVGGQVARQR